MMIRRRSLSQYPRNPPRRKRWTTLYRGFRPPKYNVRAAVTVWWDLDWPGGLPLRSTIRHTLAFRSRSHAVPMLEPPKITNRPLFHATGDPARDVMLGRGQPQWHHFAYGYKAAAKELVARLSGRGRMIEAACLPILFLYRHSVELRLKALLIDLGDLTDSPEAISKEHRLTPLWRKLRERTLAYDAGQESPWLDRAEFLVSELDRLDPGSFTFRYPVGNDGQPLIAFGQTVSIEHFADVMEELDVVLDGAAAMFDEHIQLKRDMEADFEDGYGVYY